MRLTSGLLLIGIPAQAQAADAPMTPLEFARTYVVQLAKFADLRREAAAQVAQGGGDPIKAARACVQSNNAYDREAGLAVATIDRIEREPPLKGTAVQATAHEIAENYTSRQAIARQMASACSTFAQGRKGQREAAALEGTLAKLRARSDFVDSMGDGTALMVVASLMSDRPDADGHITRATLSCAEKADLIKEIDGAFGSEFQAENPPAEVTQARSIRDNVQTLKCGDEQK